MKKSSKKFNSKIIFFCPSIEEGGVEKNLINICNNLSNEFDINLITANKNKKKLFNSKINFHCPKNNFFNKKNRLLKTLICAYLLIINFYGKRFPIISFQANIAAIIFSKILNSKVIIRSNSSPNYYANNYIKRKVMKFFYSFSNKIIVNSDEFKKEFKKYFGINSIRIYNLLEDPRKLIKLSKKKIDFKFFNNNRSLNILSVGRLVEQKDHITILKALNYIKKKKNYNFCLIGKGVLNKQLKKYVKENKLTDKIKIIGYKKNVYPYYKKADLYILSSLYEGLPNSLIEANFFNLSIISSNCKTGPKEILKRNKDAKYFKIKNYKELSYNILKIKKKSNKKIKIDSRFDFNQNLLQYRNLIRAII